MLHMRSAGLRDLWAIATATSEENKQQPQPHWKEKKEHAARRWCDPINATLVVPSSWRWRKKMLDELKEEGTEEEWKWYCLQASRDANQFHSFTNEWHSIWMQPLWQPLCISTYQRWYSQSDSILVQNYVKHRLRFTASATQHRALCLSRAEQQTAISQDNNSPTLSMLYSAVVIISLFLPVIWIYNQI